MKQFTVKDFITYNNPCFSCGEKIAFNVVSVPMQGPNNIVHLQTTVTTDFVSIDLKITYNQTLTIKIINKTNAVLYDDNKAVADYIYSHKLFLFSNCNKCLSRIDSQFLDFNLLNGYVKPVGISKESLIVMDNSHRYHVYSTAISDKSIITIDRIDKPLPISPVRIETPLLSLYKFKDRQHLINKMKIYLVFL